MTKQLNSVAPIGRKSLSVVLAVLVMGFSLSATPARGETITFTAELWMVKGVTKQLPNNCGEYTESVKPEETLHNWTELFFFGNFKKPCNPQIIEDRYNGKKQHQEKTCPGANQWKILEKGDNSLIFEHKTTGCPVWPDQIRVGLIIDGKWNRFELEYNVKGDKMKTYRQIEWLLTFAAARIVP